MLCENCNKNFATAFSSVFVDDVQQELYLCQNCLSKKELTSKIFTAANAANKKRNYTCVCGTSFDEIADSGFVSCKDCYTTFEKEFEPVILALHTSCNHRGRKKLSKLENLNLKLNQARQKNFISLALKIENEIKNLKGELNE